MLATSFALGLPEYHWSDTDFPSANANTIDLVTGPMAANGDLGVALGAEAGEDLVIGVGKNDFWGWTGKMDWHSTFNHFSPGQLRVGLALPGGGAANASFSGSQQLANATLSASFRSQLAGYGLVAREVQVLADHNVIVGELVASCPSGTDAVELNVTLLDEPLGPADSHRHMERNADHAPSRRRGSCAAFARADKAERATAFADPAAGELQHQHDRLQHAAHLCPHGWHVACA